MNRREKITSNSMLLLTAFFWGSSYAFRKIGMENLDPFYFNSIRFWMGFLVVLIAFLVKRALAKKRPIEQGDAKLENIQMPIQQQVLAGMLIGVVYSFGASAQQIALLTVDAGTCGFITSLYILFIPLISFVFLHKKIAAQVWIGAMLALSGLFLISAGVNFHVSNGTFLLLACAASYAVQIILIGHFVPKADPLLLVTVELFTGAIMSMLFSALLEDGNTLRSALGVAIPLLYTGVLSLGAANVLQFIAQKKASPSVAAIIFSFEAIFGAICGAMFLGERMNFFQITGCTLIFAAVLVAQYSRKQNV